MSIKAHCCIPCGYSCCRRSSLLKHFSSKKHFDNIENPHATIVCGFKCKNCDKIYKNNSGLWSHKKKCIAPEPVIATAIDPVNTDLLAEIVSMKGMIIELMKNRQPKTITNNNTNYINIFMNDKCRNICDVKKFIAGIDFSKENYQNLLMDYVGGNAVIITKNYNNLPEFERPVLENFSSK
jgi:hypothetical protein